MTTISGSFEQMRIYTNSGEVANVVDVDIEIPADPHVFVGVDFFSDAGLQTNVTPTAGTVVITVQTYNSDTYVGITSGTIDATAAEIKSFAGNARVVRATPAGIVGATHYKVTVTANRT